MNANNPDPTRSHIFSPSEPPGGLGAGAPATNPEHDPDITCGYEGGSPRAANVRAIPGYEVLEELGRGGMAVVHKARQLALNRTVALKTMLRVDAVSRARFLAEAEAVASIKHPHVVQVFDFGEHEGTPFLAMEYVAGGTLAEYLASGGSNPADSGAPRRDSWSLHTPLAASLLEKIASGVAAAHELGIVHRDLKPANILLQGASGEGRAAREETGNSELAPRSSPLAALSPKVADFGLAKRASGSQLTQTQAIMGTPSYMAPEQVKGAKFAGPPADVWALGVILYECLTGTRAFGGEEVEAILHAVLNGEPTAPRTLTPGVPRDLERVCLKCLEKKPSDRYPSAKELADDLRRFLDGRTVTARPVSLPVRAARWGRRNPTSAALIALVVAVSFGLAGSLVANYRRAIEQAGVERAAKEKAERAEQLAQAELVRRQEAERLANEEATRANQMTGFLAELFSLSDPLAVFGSEVVPPNYETLRNLTSRDFLDDAERKLNAGELKANPLGRARMLLVIGTSYRNLGEFGRSERLLNESLQIRRQHLPADHPEVLEVELALGRLALDNGDFFTAEDRCGRVLEVQTRIGSDPKLIAYTRSFLAWAMAMIGRPNTAAVMRVCIDERVRLFGPLHKETVFMRMGLVGHLLDHGRTLEALPELNLVLEGLRAQPDGQTRALAEVLQMFQEGVVLWQLAQSLPSPLNDIKRRQAAQVLERSLALARQALPEHHIYVGLIRFQIGAVYETLQDDARAEVEYRAALDVVRKTCGMAHPKVMTLIEHYTDLLLRTKRPWLARLLFAEVSQANRDRFGPDNYWRLPLLLTRAQFEADTDDDGKAAAFAREALALARKRPPIASRLTAAKIRELAYSLAWGPHQDVALELFAFCRPLAAAAFGDPSPQLCAVIRGQGATMYWQKRRAEGARIVREAGEMADRLGSNALPSSDAIGLERTRGMIEAHQGRFAEAEPHYRRAAAVVRSSYKRGDGVRRDVLLELASVLADREKFAEAADLVEEAYPTLAVENAPSVEAYPHFRIALLRIASGDRDRTRAALERFSAAHSTTTDALTFSYVVRARAHAPDDFGGWDSAGAARRLSASLQTRPTFVAPHRALALVQSRCGDRAAAEAAIYRFGGPLTALDHLILASIAVRAGDEAAAKQHLADADGLIAKMRPSPENPFGYADWLWMDRLEVNLLRDRVVRILERPVAPAPRLAK